MASEAGARRRDPWPESVRRAVEEAAHDRSLSAELIRSAVAEDLGVLVPTPTVRRWAAEARLRLGADRQALISEAANRAVILVLGEIARIERQPSSRRDLQRLDQAVRTLKTLEGVNATKSAKGPQTLEGLTQTASDAA